MQDAPRIFISFGGRQRSWALALSSHLSSLGLSPFLSDAMEIGTTWVQRLETEIEQCDLFLVLVSPEAIASDWVRREVNAAFRTKRTIVPILLAKAELTNFLSQTQAYDLTSYSVNAYRELLFEITKCVGIPVEHSRISKLKPPDPPAILLPDEVFDALKALVLDLCHEEYRLLGLCTELEIEAKAVGGLTPRLSAQTVVVLACDRATKSPLQSAQQMIHRWKGKPKSFNADLLKAAATSVQRHLRSAPVPAKKGMSANPAEEQYRSWLQEQMSGAQLGAFEAKLREPILLADIYAPQQGSFSYTPEPTQEEPDPELRRTTIPLRECIDAVAGRDGNVGVILGPAGSGKTTTLRLTAWSILAGDPSMATHTLSLMPFFFPLRALRRGSTGVAGQLKQILAQQGQTLDSSFIDDLLHRGSVVMLDGLDEIADQRARRTAVEWIEKQAHQYPTSIFLVTCRDNVYRTTNKRFSSDVLRIDVEALTKSEITLFVEKWYTLIAERHGQLGLPPLTKTPKKEANRLLDVIESREDLSRMATNPLMLEIMSLVNLTRGALPQKRVDLFRECITILGRRDVDAGGDLPEALEDLDIVELLEWFAFWLHAVIGASKASAEDAISALRSPEVASHLPPFCEELFKKLGDRGSIISINERGECAFEHQVFQEYLAASWIHSRGDYAIALENVGNSWWKETILLLMSHRRPAPFKNFMSALASTDLFSTDRELVLELIRGAEGASRPPDALVAVLSDSERDFDARYTALLGLRETGLGDQEEHVRSALLRDSSRLGELGRLLLSVPTAPPAGTELPTRWTNPVDGMEHVLVPAGSFPMGAREDDPLSIRQETPQGIVGMDAYYIAIHPVTNGQYEKFLKETGRRAPRGQHDWDLWVSERHAPGMANHPVVNVSWYDALYYCEWARSMLPTEGQWEKAAKGTDDRLYPWGDESSQASSVMNFSNVVGRTSEVGLYPGGCSPYGCLDMSGNVWEWCWDWFSRDSYWRGEGPHHNPSGVDHGDRRVDRGGGWQMDARRCRSVYRSGWPPGSSDCDLGFRTALSVERALSSSE